MKKNKVITNKDTIKIPIPRLKNPWILIIILLIICLVLFYFLVNKPIKISSGQISGQEAGQKIANFLSDRSGQNVQYASYQDLGNIYEITVSYQNETIPVYATKDGNYFIQGAIPI